MISEKNKFIKEFVLNLALKKAQKEVKYIHEHKIYTTKRLNFQENVDLRNLLIQLDDIMFRIDEMIDRNYQKLTTYPSTN